MTRQFSGLFRAGLLPMAAALTIGAGAYPQITNAQTSGYTAAPAPTPLIPSVTAVGGDNAPRLGERPVPKVQAPDGQRGSMAPLRLLDPPEPVVRPNPAPSHPAPVYTPPPVPVMSEPTTTAMPRPAPPVSRVEVAPLPAPVPAADPVPVSPPPAPPAAAPAPVVQPPVISPQPGPAVVKVTPPPPAAPAAVASTPRKAESAPVTRPAENKPVAPSRAAAPAPRQPSTVRLTKGAYIRAVPDRNGRVVDALDAGTILQVLPGGDAEWIKVGQKGKAIGYVSVTVVSAGTSAGSKATPATSGAAGKSSGRYEKAAAKDNGCALPKAVTTKPRKSFSTGMTVRVTAAANLRVAPACDAKVRDVLETGERVTIMAVRDGWYQVGRRGKALGYVGGALLSPAGN